MQTESIHDYLSTYIKQENLVFVDYCSRCSKPLHKHNVKKHKCSPRDSNVALTNYMHNYCKQPSKFYWFKQMRQLVSLYTCEKCAFRTFDINDINRHVMKCHQENPKMAKAKAIKCPRCCEVFVRKGGIQQHICKNFLQVTRKFKCNMCPFTSTDIKLMEPHRLTHLKKTKPKLRSKSNKCSKRFASLNPPLEVNQLFGCKKCKFRSVDIKVLESHLWTHLKI